MSPLLMLRHATLLSRRFLLVPELIFVAFVICAIPVGAQASLWNHPNFLIRLDYTLADFEAISDDGHIVQQQ
jgi:hypothetical protein